MDENRNNKFIYDENIINDNNSENDYISEDDINYDYEKYIYDEETINIIQKNLLEYVEENYLPLCEYLSLEKISIFINKVI
jgi:hypothetical protein